MLQFTIQALHEAMMNPQSSPQDYLSKDRKEWNIYDWLCALSAGIQDNEPGQPARPWAVSVKATINELLSMKQEFPTMTADEMMAVFGRKLKGIHGTLL